MLILLRDCPYPYATENGVRRSFSAWNTFPDYTAATEDYQVDSYEGSLKLLASTPLGPLTPYAGLGGRYQVVDITGEMKGYRSTNSALVISYQDSYRFTNALPVTVIAGADWDILPNLRFNLEGEALGEWSVDTGLTYLFP